MKKKFYYDFVGSLLPKFTHQHQLRTARQNKVTLTNRGLCWYTALPLQTRQ